MTARRPNILFIVADDLGWADLSVYGQRDYETPHLDRLAAEGVRFTQAYSNSAVCSATRFALMTGRYQYRLAGGLEEPIAPPSKHGGLPPEHPTLPSLLGAAGYRTALIGKWHLGRPPEYGPLRSGYQEFFGNLGGAIDYFTHKPGVGDHVPRDLWDNDVPVERVGYYTQILADEASAWVARQSAARPFLLSLHFTAPHWPWVGPDDEAVSRGLKSLFHYDGGNLATYAKMVRSLDAAVGQVLAALDRSGRADDTIVVFTKAGTTTEQVGISMDWLPTLLEAAGVAADPRYPSDGLSILPVLRGDQSAFARTLYWRYKSNAQRALREGDWKYLKINENEFLFDVVADTLERANLRHKHPELFARLKADWERWSATMLPITDEVFSHAVSPSVQADRYHSDGVVLDQA